MSEQGREQPRQEGVADVLEFLREERSMGEALEDPDATTTSGEEVNWQGGIMAPLDDAIAKLEQGDSSAACNLLDGFIANVQRAMGRDKDDTSRQQHKESLEKLEGLRRLVG